ncbi:hypothetical protein LX32DRAFT_248598 [Colletotrichum zoysiae]|uniref:Uncharacterized protein n=1 Tax=Colletotrichum zoysiae TaxID=1216348 RepID=A0AAD9H353_9PEZI|nr:hypothetical protein LX32DRAFT_248598 [Colletotrichum zoysiae]
MRHVMHTRSATPPPSPVLCSGRFRDADFPLPSDDMSVLQYRNTVTPTHPIICVATHGRRLTRQLPILMGTHRSAPQGWLASQSYHGKGLEEEQTCPPFHSANANSFYDKSPSPQDPKPSLTGSPPACFCHFSFPPNRSPARLPPTSRAIRSRQLICRPRRSPSRSLAIVVCVHQPWWVCQQRPSCSASPTP